MKKKIFALILCLFMVLTLMNYEKDVLFSSTENKIYYNSIEQMINGVYTSSDGKTIKIEGNTTIVYEDTYSLTLKESNRGDTITGQIGTDKKSVTFYQLNDSTIMSDASVTYTHSGASTVLLENTVFKLNKTVETNASGKIELYDNNNLINKYDSIQDAVDSASNGNVIKILDNLDVVGATYINKNITIDGNNKTLNYSTWSNSVFILEEGINFDFDMVNDCCISHTDGRGLPVLIKDYEGDYYIEAFDPRCVVWLRSCHPDTIRGQLTQNYFRSKNKLPFSLKFMLRHQLLNCMTKPDFVAYKFEDRITISNIIARKVWGIQGVAWTITSQEDFDLAIKEGWVPIFEGFIPE